LIVFHIFIIYNQIILPKEGKMKRIVSLLALILVVSGLTACAGGTSSPDTIKIGVNLELTGPVAVYGTPERLAFEMALAEVNAKGGVNGKLLELVIYDNAYDTAKAVENATKLATQDGVVAMLGSATSAPTLAIGPVAKQFEVLTFTPSGTNSAVTMDGTSVNPWVFRACFIDPFQGVVLANFASGTLGASRAVIMGSSSSDYAKELAAVFGSQFAKNGGTVVTVEYYTDTDTDFSAQLTTIRNSGDFDVLFIADYAERAGLIIGQARDAGITVPIVGPDGFESPDLNSLAGGADKVNNVFFSTHFSVLSQDPKVLEFIANYEAFTGEKPSALSALAYDAFYMLVAAIEVGGSDPKAVRDALQATTAFQGITGTISFDAFNNPIKSAVIVELQNGEQVSAKLINP
jgi:branched-chain amino acid transport system substrate-binding protein